MGCLKGGTVAGSWSRPPDYVRFATHYGFRPDFCEGQDPESKGLVENLVGYVKSDLMIPAELTVTDLAAANAAGRLWCVEVNAAVHSEIAAVPAERLVTERALLRSVAVAASPDRQARDPQGRPALLRPVRVRPLLGARPATSADRSRSASPTGVVQVVLLGAVIAEHPVVAPGEASVNDDHYGGARPRSPPGGAPQDRGRDRVLFAWDRPLRRSSRQPPRQGSPRWPATSTSSPASKPPTARDALIAALERAIDVRSVPRPRRPVDPRRRHRCRPSDPARRRAHRRPPSRRDTTAVGLRDRRPDMTAPTPTLPADLDAGLRRLRLGAMRRLAPELLVTAKTQRWAPEEFLRTLVETEIASRDASNTRARLKAAAFPVTKTLDEFDVTASSIKPATFDYLTSLEWIAAKENVCLVGPAGTGKSPPARRPRPRRHRRRAPGPLLHRRRTRRDPLPRASPTTPSAGSSRPSSKPTSS